MTINRPFPLCTQQAHLGYTYLRRNAIHHELTDCLKRSIMVIARGSNQNGGGCVCELDHEEVLRAGNEWGVAVVWTFHFFDVDEDAGTQSKWYRVRLHIKNFLLEFWHETFIQSACSGFGEVRHIEERNIYGNDHSLLELDLACIDPHRILPPTLLPFGSKWKQMYILIVDWEYNDCIPDEAKFTPQDCQALHLSSENPTDMLRLYLLVAHDKLLRYFNTPDLSTPPPSPSYFLDDTVENPETNQNTGYSIKSRTGNATRDPITIPPKIA